MSIGVRAVVAIVIAALSGHAQEPDPHDPAIIADGLKRASDVVVGTFGMDWCLPWFDGWHCSGGLHVQETLYGDRSANRVLPLRWQEPYGTTCLISEKLSRFKGERGIWYVAQKNGEWKLSKTLLWGGGPFPLDCRDAVLQGIRQRSGR